MSVNICLGLRLTAQGREERETGREIDERTNEEVWTTKGDEPRVLIRLHQLPTCIHISDRISLISIRQSGERRTKCDK